MSDKIKWSVAGVLVMRIVNNEILSWAILTALAFAWAWQLVKECAAHD